MIKATSEMTEFSRSTEGCFSSSSWWIMKFDKILNVVTVIDVIYRLLTLLENCLKGLGRVSF